MQSSQSSARWCWPGGCHCAQSGCTVTWVMGLSCAPIASSLGQDVHVAGHISMTLICSRVGPASLSHGTGILCVVFGEKAGMGEGVAFSGQVSISSLPGPLQGQHIAFSHIHISPSMLCFGSLFPTPRLFSSHPY